MSYITEYIDNFKKGWGPLDLEKELNRLIAEYNTRKKTYLFVYAASVGKPIPEVALDQKDFYTICDLLRAKKGQIDSVDMYLETPGGSGEAAEEIVEFLHDHFKNVSFVVSGEAKSAGTIMALSGDDILMTETGSLGPIDAQMKIGRSVISAYDYIDWVEKRRDEASKATRLNPFDATMVAQITPGELGGVLNALKFAEDLVREWLPKYKFKNWSKHSDGRPVTHDEKEAKAAEIAANLINHSQWRSHGRSIKMKDLENIGLRITNLEKTELCEIVCRIQVVCTLLFEATSIFKIFATQDGKIFRQAIPAGMQQRKNPMDASTLKLPCPKCGKEHMVYAKLTNNPEIDKDLQGQGYIPFPKEGKLNCACGFEIDLIGVKNQVEAQSGKRVIV